MELDCRRCSDTQKEWRGCTKPSQVPQFELDGETIDRCPLKLIERQSAEYIKFYNFMEKGFLPNPGGILSQGAKFLDVITVINMELNKIRELEKESKLGSRVF